MEDLLKKNQNTILSDTGVSHQYGSEENTIRIMVTMDRTMLRYAALICPNNKFYSDIWQMEMDYALWIYNWIHNMQYGLSAIKMCPRSRFEPMPETLSNF